jgi:hypothetical protein
MACVLIGPQPHRKCLVPAKERHCYSETSAYKDNTPLKSFLCHLCSVHWLTLFRRQTSSRRRRKSGIRLLRKKSHDWWIVCLGGLKLLLRPHEMVVFYLCIFFSSLSLTPKEYVDRTSTVTQSKQKKPVAVSACEPRQKKPTVLRCAQISGYELPLTKSVQVKGKDR